MVATTHRHVLPVHVWTEAEDAYLREHYRVGGKPSHVIAHALGLRPEQVRYRAKCLQLRRHNGQMRRFWTEAEDDYLKEHYGDQSTPAIAHRLQRTEYGVRFRARVLGLWWTQQRTNWYSSQDVADMIGVSRSWVTNRIRRGELRGRMDGPLWRVERTSLRAWLMEHPDELQGRNVDLQSVFDIVLGGISPETLNKWEAKHYGP